MQAQDNGDQNARVLDLLAGAFAGDPAATGMDVHYQPIVRLGDSATVAVEALVRWRHPALGRVAPELFVALAERAGFISVIDNLVLDRACADASALTHLFGRGIDLHVNVSAARLGAAELEAAVAGALDRHRLSPGQLVLEITETSQIRSLAAAASAAQRLHDLGVRLALDDFGAGFNALLQLHALPVDFVKLDAALTGVSFDLPRGQALCRSVLSLSAELGAMVIAEGIETVSQVDALSRLGCRLGQGYLYGMPLRLPRRARPRMAG